MTIYIKTVKRNRETGTTIHLIDNREGEYDFGGPQWFTECETHGYNCGHMTRQDATQWMAQPSMWCEECQNISGESRATDSDKVLGGTPQ